MKVILEQTGLGGFALSCILWRATEGFILEMMFGGDTLSSRKRRSYYLRTGGLENSSENLRKRKQVINYLKEN